MPEITLVTPTSDRSTAFQHCERWMQRAIAHYGRAVEWIVVDDGRSPAPCTMQQRHVRREKSATRANSFLTNLSAGLRLATTEKILFIEDDDWYAPEYITTMSKLLDNADIVGQGRARYYNLATRCYKVLGNTRHASLCQTGIRRPLVDWMLQHIERFQRTAIDLHTWRTGAQSLRRHLMLESTLAVGMKGLPGTAGIGRGHRNMRGMAHDPDGRVLARWTSEADAQIYSSLRNVHSMKHALCILTYAPADASPTLLTRLPKAITSLQETGYNGPVCIVDDGSDNEGHLQYLDTLASQYQVVRRPENGGISRAKNTCIRVLMDHGVEVGFIAEDDIAFRPGWHHQYLRAHEAIPQMHHMSWAWDQDPSGAMRKHRVRLNGVDIARTSRLNGVFLSFTPKVVAPVGRFRILPAKWGHSHTNWTRRIIQAGLSPFFADILNSNRYIRCNDSASASVFDASEKQRFERMNRHPANDINRIYCKLEE